MALEKKPYQDRFNAMWQEKENWMSTWRDLQKFIMPTRGSFDNVEPNKGTPIDHKVILNGHASRALGKLAAGMTSGLTSPSRPWFKLGLSDDDLQQFDPVKEWLGMIQERMMAVYAKSNIYGPLHGIYLETGGFGTGAMAVLPDREDVIRGRLYTCGEYTLATGADCRVNSFGRQQWMTVGQMVEDYGIENVSESVKNLYQNKQVDKWMSIKQLIQPNPEAKDEREQNPMSKYKKFRSCHWEQNGEGDKFLRVGGFRRFPILAPRWDTRTTADVYGIGPAWDALGDVKMLQKMEKDFLMALDKVADPPVQADGNVAEQVNLLPGGLTRSSATSPNAGVRPVYLLTPDFNAIDAKIQKTMSAISEAFFADLFSMISTIDRSNVTALEIAKRNEEKLILLGPVLERLESELLDPLIDLTFDIMLDAGLIPPPPEELQGVEINVEYISMLAQAQKMVGVTAVQQLVSFAGTLASGKPEVLDKIDADEAIDQYANMLGTPPKIVVSDELVAVVRKKRQEDQKAAEIAATMPSIVAGAKTMSETKMGQNSALDAMLQPTGGLPPGQ